MDDEDEGLKDIIEHKEKDNVDFSTISPEDKYNLSRTRPNQIGVWVLLVIFLVHFNGFAVQETITTPIATDKEHKYTDTLDYSPGFAYVLFACSGFLSLMTFLVLKRVDHLMSDRNWVLLSSFMGMVGYLIIIDF